MSISHLTKIFALAIIMWAEYMCWYPPHKVTLRYTELSRYGWRPDLITRFPGLVPTVTLSIAFPAHLCETAALLARAYPSPLADHVLAMLFGHSPDRAADVDRLASTPAFMIGFVLLALGGAGRKMSYDALGRFYTFELAVLEGHKLRTSGPYAIVRHPAYTADIVATVGLLVVHLCPASYLFESRALALPAVRVAVGIWAVYVGNVARTALWRVQREDAVLRREFGKEWEEWAKRTPYRLIPYVY